MVAPRCFNPHPPVGAGATCHELPSGATLRSFQSSPARGGGCNVGERGGCGGLDAVSILTRPWGRVQPKQVLTTVIEATFQSSPAHGGGCNRP